MSELSNISEIVDSTVELSIGQINALSIDDLLTYRKDNVKIKLKTNEKFEIRWKNDELDIDPEVADNVINTIKAIRLQQEIKSDVVKQYKKTFKKIAEFNDENTTIAKDLFRIDVDGDLKNISDQDIEKLNVGIFNSDPRLATINGKVDYITEKLNITDITEVMFVVLALVVSEKA